MSNDYFTNGHMSKVKSGVSINPMVLIRFSSLFRLLSRNALLVLQSCSSSSSSQLLTRELWIVSYSSYYEFVRIESVRSRAGPSTRLIRQLPKAPRWNRGPKILEKKGQQGKKKFLVSNKSKKILHILLTKKQNFCYTRLNIGSTNFFFGLNKINYPKNNIIILQTNQK